MKTVEIAVYQFNELSDSAKETAREWYRSTNGEDTFWSDCVFEDAKEIGLKMGIDIDKIYFSGFSSQGDGACFEGYYSYQKGSVKSVKNYAPLDKELHSIAEGLQKTQKRVFYTATASVKQRGHYMHSNCTSVDVGMADEYGQAVFSEVEDELTELLRDFMNWIYSRLEKEWDCINSDESVDESITIYEFTEDGQRY